MLYIHNYYDSVLKIGGADPMTLEEETGILKTENKALILAHNDTRP